jgi:hypothetical protein
MLRAFFFDRDTDATRSISYALRRKAWPGGHSEAQNALQWKMQKEANIVRLPAA